MSNIASRFSYPPLIDEVIDDFVVVCRRVFEGDRLGILLVGSTARGEFSWSQKGNRLCFNSDIEFIVVVDTKDSRRADEFASQIGKLDKKRDLGERFKIDFVVNTWGGIRKVEKRILVFDSKNTGIELGDYPIRPCLPEVTKYNINFRELNDVLLHRMKNLLREVPGKIFTQPEHLDAFRQSIAKNTLDITTWLYPYEADELISGFEKRLEKWEKRRGQMRLSEYFGNTEFDFLNMCIAVRKGDIGDVKIPTMLCGYVEIYKKAISYCKFMNNLDMSSSISEPRISAILFWEYSFRRRLKEAYLILKNAGKFGARRVMRNIFYPRKGRQVAFCFSMIETLQLMLLNSKKAENKILESKALLSNLMLVTEYRDENQSAQWLDLRDQYITINSILI